MVCGGRWKRLEVVAMCMAVTVAMVVGVTSLFIVAVGVTKLGISHGHQLDKEEHDDGHKRNTLGP